MRFTEKKTGYIQPRIGTFGNCNKTTAKHALTAMFLEGFVSNNVFVYLRFPKTICKVYGTRKPTGINAKCERELSLSQVAFTNILRY